MISTLYTLVIPAFNAKDTIERCLMTVAEQLSNREEVEVIVVDDGSVDGTADIAEAIIARSGLLHAQVIRQANAGVSVARNSGIGIAKGTYIGFLDSDDYWLPGHWAAIAQKMTGAALPDIIELNARMVDLQDAFLSDVDVSLAGDHVENIDVGLLVRYASLHKHFPWARVYRAELFRARLFAEGRHYEDNGAIPWIYFEAKTICSINVPLIAYVIKNKHSITGTAKYSHSVDLAYFAQEATEQAQKHPTHSRFWYLIAANAVIANIALILRLPFGQQLRALREAKKVGSIPDGQIARRLQVKSNFPITYFLFLSVKALKRGGHRESL